VGNPTIVLGVPGLGAQERAASSGYSPTTTASRAAPGAM
jgi:hypothetical protein